MIASFISEIEAFPPVNIENIPSDLRFLKTGANPSIALLTPLAHSYGIPLVKATFLPAKKSAAATIPSDIVIIAFFIFSGVTPPPPKIAFIIPPLAKDL